MNASYADLQHTAQPRLRPSRIVGRCIFNTCEACRLPIWRTAERFVWQHSEPSRTERLAVLPLDFSAVGHDAYTSLLPESEPWS